MSIEDFDLTMSYFFTEKYSEEWNERLAYVRSLDTSESSLILNKWSRTGKIFFGDELPDFLTDYSKNGIYDVDPEENIIIHFPEAKIAKLYAEAFGYEGTRCYACGEETYPFIKPKFYDLCEKCHLENESRVRSQFPEFLNDSEGDV